MGIDSAYGIGSLKQGVCTSSTRPASPFEGQVIFETDTDRLYVYNGTAWVIPNSPAQNPQGLELVTTATCSSGGTASGGVVTIGSAVSSVTVDAFSSTYDAYKIVVHGGAASTTIGVELTLGTSVTGYSEVRLGYRYDNVGVSAAGQANAASWNIARSNTDVLSFQCELLGPFIAKPTTATWAYNDTRAIAGTAGFLGNGFHSAATSYTSFKITFVAGTQTGGTIRVYGYRNS